MTEWESRMCSDKETAESVVEEQQTKRKTYSSPKIAKFGAVSRLTQGSGGGMMDANGFIGMANMGMGNMGMGMSMGMGM